MSASLIIALVLLAIDSLWALVVAYREKWRWLALAVAIAVLLNLWITHLAHG